jgi:Flp pilus assembly pilin Flp
MPCRRSRLPSSHRERHIRLPAARHALATAAATTAHRRWPAREEGQATVEYALVVLAAAAVALLLIAWAARTGKIGQLLDLVFDQVLAKAG